MLKIIREKKLIKKTMSFEMHKIKRKSETFAWFCFLNNSTGAPNKIKNLFVMNLGVSTLNYGPISQN